MNIPNINFGAGVCLGDRFDVHPYERLGIPVPGDTWQESWGSAKITKDYIRALKKLGFKTVKLAVTWYPHVIPINNRTDYIIEDWFLHQLREVIDWIIEEDMYCIIDMHHDEDWINAEQEEVAKENYRHCWIAICNGLKDYPYDSLFYESLNEVGLEINNLWFNQSNELNEIFYDIVRKYDSEKRTVILEGPWSDIKTTLESMQILDHYDNYILGVHFYEPWQFTVMGKDYNPTYEIDWFCIESKLIMLPLIQEKYKVPIIISESGCNLYNRDKDVVIRWFKKLYEKCKSYGISVLLWEDGHEEKSMIDPKTHAFNIPEFADILKKYKM